MFKNRLVAGRELGRALQKYGLQNPLVLAIPRGGVEVGLEVAKLLQADFSLLISRKLPCPDNPKAGFGAIAEDGSSYIRVKMVRRFPREAIYRLLRQQADAVRRGVDILRKGRQLPKMSGRIVILVDDGLAFGSTMKAAVLLCRKKGAARIIVAVPVSREGVMDEIKWIADEVIVLESQANFSSVSQAYQNSHELSEDEVLNILQQWVSPKNKEVSHGQLQRPVSIGGLEAGKAHPRH
jgi:putative phosphoribosyl transferase